MFFVVRVVRAILKKSESCVDCSSRELYIIISCSPNANVKVSKENCGAQEGALNGDLKFDLEIYFEGRFKVDRLSCITFLSFVLFHSAT